MSISGDETFTRFRRNLEDGVMVALDRGVPIKRDVPGGEACCPLGAPAGTGRIFSRPGKYWASDKWSIAPDDAEAFANGFDGLPAWFASPYYELGQLYRARFP